MLILLECSNYCSMSNKGEEKLVKSFSNQIITNEIMNCLLWFTLFCMAFCKLFSSSSNLDLQISVLYSLSMLLQGPLCEQKSHCCKSVWLFLCWQCGIVQRICEIWIEYEWYCLIIWYVCFFLPTLNVLQV